MVDKVGAERYARSNLAATFPIISHQPSMQPVRKSQHPFIIIIIIIVIVVVIVIIIVIVIVIIIFIIIIIKSSLSSQDQFGVKLNSNELNNRIGPPVRHPLKRWGCESGQLEGWMVRWWP